MGFSGSATLFDQIRQSAAILFCDIGARGRFVFLTIVDFVAGRVLFTAVNVSCETA